MMENPEEILHILEEFTKLKPKDIPRELEEYLCIVAKTGDPVYQWSAVKSLFREKLINVITEFYESCPSVEIPPCPNVEVFNYDTMKNFILEKLDTFAAAPFTVQRICELLTTPRKEYNRIDKYMRALEKNILVVSTTEPGNRRNTENGDSIVNGIESEHAIEPNSCNDINVEEMDDTPAWSRMNPVESNSFINIERTTIETSEISPNEIIETSECRLTIEASTSNESVITCTVSEKLTVSEIAESTEEREAVAAKADKENKTPAPVQQRRNSIEPASDNSVDNIEINTDKDDVIPEIEKDEKTESVAENEGVETNADSSSNDTIETEVSPEIVNKSESEADSSESFDSTEYKIENPESIEKEEKQPDGEAPKEEAVAQEAAETPRDESPEEVSSTGGDVDPPSEIEQTEEQAETTSPPQAEEKQIVMEEGEEEEKKEVMEVDVEVPPADTAQGEGRASGDVPENSA